MTPSCTPAAQQDLSTQKVEDINLSASLSHSCHFPTIPLSVKRKLEMVENPCVLPPPKISLTRKWKPPPFSKKEAKQSASIELKRARPHTPNTELSDFLKESLTNSSEAAGISEKCKGQPTPEQGLQPCKQKCGKTIFEETTALSVGKIKPKFVSDQTKKRTKALREDPDGRKTHNRSKDTFSTAFLTSDPRVKDSMMLNKQEQNKMLEKASRAKVVMLTLVYRDGTSLLDPEQVSKTVCVFHSFVISLK